MAWVECCNDGQAGGPQVAGEDSAPHIWSDRSHNSFSDSFTGLIMIRRHTHTTQQETRINEHPMGNRKDFET